MEDLSSTETDASTEAAASAEAGAGWAGKVMTALTVLFVAGLAAAGAVTVVKLTLIRPYCTGDSASYLGAARNLLHGRGLTLPWGTPTDRPLVHFPPLYPAALAAFGLLGPDPISVSRWMNALLFGANIILAALAVYAVTRRRLLACLAAVLVAASPTMLRFHTAALSEPLFIFLLLPALMALHAYAQRPARRLFLLACVATALALLCRWTAVPLVVTGAAVFCLCGPGGLRRRLARGAAFGFLSCLPLGLWMLRNLRLGGTATNRTFASHPITADLLSEGLRTVSRWAVPSFRPGVSEGHSLVPMALLCLGAAGLAARFVLKRSDGGMRERLRRLPWTYIFFGLLYCAFLLVSVSYFDRMTPLSDRILSPAYLAWLVALLGMWSCAWAPGVSPWPVRGIVLLAWLAVAFLQVRAGVGFARFEHARTRYTASSWDAWETRLVESIPRGQVVYSNRPEDFYIYVGRAVKEWPSPVDVWSGRPAPDYQERLDAAVRELERTGGRLVLLGTSQQPWLSPDQLPRGVPLVRVGQAGKVNVFGLRSRSARRPPGGT